jgi:hypothetical protein
MNDFDFFDTPITPVDVLQEKAEVTIHVRDTATMEQKSVRAIVAKSIENLPEGKGERLHVFGRLGVHITDDWFIHVLEELDDEALSTDHTLAQKMDMEQSLGSVEKFKESRYRKPKEG